MAGMLADRAVSGQPAYALRPSPMTAPSPPSLQRLRSLLNAAPESPAERIEQLREERLRVAGSDTIAHELLAADLSWVTRQPEAGGGELGAACDAARRQWLILREHALARSEEADASTLLDFAEVRGEALLLGMEDLAARCSVGIDRVAENLGGDEMLREESAEREAVLMAAVEESSLPRQIALLRANAEAMRVAAARVGDDVVRRRARRLGRTADDRELALRLERRLGKRGVAVYETLNFVLLIAVLAILTVEFSVDLAPATATILHWIDGLACVFFVVAFGFEFALAPRRGSWFVRNVLTDLLPAIPSVLWLLPVGPVPGAADKAVAIRVLRVLRVTWAARYVQMLRPFLRSARFLLFLIRGMDGLVQRFARILDRELVFVPAAAEVQADLGTEDRRDLLFAALDRERELIHSLDRRQRIDCLLHRAEAIREQAASLGPSRTDLLRVEVARRDIAVGHAVEVLWSVRPQDVGRWMRQADTTALDRVIRVISAVPARWLPFVRRLAVHPMPATAEERIASFSHRVAEWIETWHGRLLFHADLHGIVTGPQILDRVATALIKATQRPAVRLLLFGALFLLLAWIAPENGLTVFVRRIVGLPLVVLGSICLIGLALGRWMKSVAGEAADAYRMTSEAHFLPQIELTKCRYENVDLPFLARRVFGDGHEGEMALPILRSQIRGARAGVPVDGDGDDLHLRLMTNRIALLYLNFLDGAPLHLTDVKTTEQLLANKAIENLREQFLHPTRRDRKRLNRLRLDEGSLLGGPYLWFSFITESIAVEVAKRIEGYNRFCIPLGEREAATPEQREAMRVWLERRRDPKGGRTLAAIEAVRSAAYPTTEFNAIDFVGDDPERDRHIAFLFGEEVLEVLRTDRRTMIREVFGTRPVHHLPKRDRSFNPLRFYRERLSHGRILLAPLFLCMRFFRLLVWIVARVRQVVREVLDPELAMSRREIGAAPFAVALRKIHRMKAPGLLEAVRTRLRLDAGYSGAPTGWSEGAGFREDSDLERDLAFLHLHDREAMGLRDRATEVRRATAELHAAVGSLPAFPPCGAHERRCGEFAVTSAWIADKDSVRTLMQAERWRDEDLPAILEEGAPGSFLGDAGRAIAALFVVPVTDTWVQRHGGDLPARARRLLRRAWASDHRDTRRILGAWSGIDSGRSPREVAFERLVAVYGRGPSVWRDVMTLRAVQSMAVLDVRNYRDLVFGLGDYAADGEERDRWCALP